MMTLTRPSATRSSDSDTILGSVVVGMERRGKREGISYPIINLLSRNSTVVRKRDAVV